MKCVWAAASLALVHGISVGSSFAQAEKKLVPPPAPRKTDTLTIAGGNAQNIARQSAIDAVVFAPLSVVVKDAAGRPIAGTRIDWSCIAKAASLKCDIGSKKFSLTDGKGVATLTELEAGTRSASVAGGEGSLNVEASYGKTQLKASFTLTVAPLKPTLTILSGDGQSIPLVEHTNHSRSAEFGPAVVAVTDPTGKPIANQTISWKCVGCLYSSMTSATDAEGKSNVRVQALAEGPVTLTATAGEATTTFRFTVLPQAPPRYKLLIVSGDKQEVPVGPHGARSAPFVVKLLDEAGNPLAKRWIGARCAPVGGACNLTFLGSSNSALTKEDGTARFAYVLDGPMGALLYGGATGATVRMVAVDANPVVFELKVKQ